MVLQNRLQRCEDWPLHKPWHPLWALSKYECTTNCTGHELWVRSWPSSIHHSLFKVLLRFKDILTHLAISSPVDCDWLQCSKVLVGLDYFLYFCLGKDCWIVRSPDQWSDWQVCEGNWPHIIPNDRSSTAICKQPIHTYGLAIWEFDNVAAGGPFWELSDFEAIEVADFMK